VESLHEQREQDVITAAREAHEAWLEMERETRRAAHDEAAVRARRDRWRASARSLVGALDALKRRG
jgi:hypothetical protein